MYRCSILTLILLAPWTGTVSATDADTAAVSVCQCMSIGRQDPLAQACMKLSDSLSDAAWDAEFEACEAQELQLLASHLRNCAALTQAFIHPWTGEQLERIISGMKNGSCHYRVDLPQGGKLECRLPPERLDDMAYYYENSALFKKAKIKTSVSIVDGQQVTTNRFFVDGEEIVNPMQVSLDNRDCVVTDPQN